MTQIYKINHVVEDNINRIYLFIGDEIIDKKDYIDSRGQHIFSAEELENIKKKKIPIQLITSHVIHGDDTIGMIKKKIMQGLKLEISTKELYIFGITEDKLIPSILYNQLTQNKTIPLTEKRLCQLLLNIIEHGCEQSDIINTCKIIGTLGNNISFNEFLNIQDWDLVKSHIIPIGQRLVYKKTIPFVANPYNCTHIDHFIKENIPGIVTTLNTSLLFEVGDLCFNNIFFCTAEEVLTYTSKVTKIEESDILNLYFPLLATKDKIQNLISLQDKRQELYDKEEAQLGATFNTYNKQIDLFYNIYNAANIEAPLNYLNDTPVLPPFHKLSTLFIILNFH